MTSYYCSLRIIKINQHGLIELVCLCHELYFLLSTVKPILCYYWWVELTWIFGERRLFGSHWLIFCHRWSLTPDCHNYSFCVLWLDVDLFHFYSIWFWLSVNLAMKTTFDSWPKLLTWLVTDFQDLGWNPAQVWRRFCLSFQHIILWDRLTHLSYQYVQKLPPNKIICHFCLWKWYNLLL